MRTQRPDRHHQPCQLTYSKTNHLTPKQAPKTSQSQLGILPASSIFTPLAGKNQQTLKEQWVRGRRTRGGGVGGGSLRDFGAAGGPRGGCAGRSTPGATRSRTHQEFCAVSRSSPGPPRLSPLPPRKPSLRPRPSHGRDPHPRLRPFPICILFNSRV